MMEQKEIRDETFNAGKSEAEVKKPATFLPPKRPMPPKPPPLPSNTAVEEKPQKQKKIKLTKKQVIIISSISAFVLAIILTVTLVLLNQKPNTNAVLKENSQVTIVKAQNNFYLQATPQQVGVVYVYELKIDEKIVILKSANNSVDVSNLITKPQEYQVRFYIENYNSKSAVSKWVSFNNYFTLNSPNVVYNAEDNTLSWQGIENASKYKIFYAIGQEFKTFIFTPTQSQDENIGRIVFDINLLNLPFGQFSVCVSAIPDETLMFYKESQVSNYSQIDNYGKKLAPIGATYNMLTNILVIDATNLEAVEQFEIIFGSFQFTFTPTIKRSIYELSIAEFTDYQIQTGEGIFIKVLSNQEFILSSNQVIVNFIN